MKDKSFVRKVLAVVCVGLLAGALFAIVGCSCSQQSSSSASSSSKSASDTMTVPNVVSLTQADAEKALRAAGFVVGTVTREASDKVPADSVISQDPKALASANKGSKINLVVSSGKAALKDVNVPDLKGKSQDDAEKALADVGLVGVASNPEETTEVAPGQVFKQSVAPGTTVKERTKVAFTVALAPAEVTVPDVIGKTFDDAKAIIKGAGLGFDFTVAYDDKAPENTIIGQSVAAGTNVKSGSTVSVVMSLGPRPTSDVKVPDVTTFSWSDAEKALESAGLTARYTGDPAGVVVSQDVAAGTMVAPGTLVTVTLASPLPHVTVPDIKGMSVTSADIALTNIGLTLDTSTGSTHGKIVDQWPEPGTQVETRSTVYATVDDSEFK